MGQLREGKEEPKLKTKDKAQETGRGESMGFHHTNYWRIKGEYVS